MNTSVASSAGMNLPEMQKGPVADNRAPLALA